MANPTRFPVFRESDLGIKDGQVDGAVLREAFRKLFAQINPGLDTANRATSRGLSFSDNLKCDIVSGSFANGVASTFALTNLTKANSALLLGCDSAVDGHPIIRMGTPVGTKQMVTITLFFKDVSSTSVKCTLMLIAEGQQQSTTASSQQAWQNATLINSWVNFGPGANFPAGYFMDAFGIVHLRGVVSTGTIGTAAFVLPAAYRPTLNVNAAAVSNAAFGYLAVIAASGNVTPVAGSNTWFSFDGITFDTRQ